ncbi:MAG: hypothetical protein AB9866_07725 [Syntrophobacteraceae bacterium]
MTLIISLEQLKAELSGEVTEKFLQALLQGMEWCFILSSSYRRNIENFTATYVFGTADNRVCQAVKFVGGKMKVSPTAPLKWNVRVVFKDVPALQRFLFSRDQDILSSVLANEVEVAGNLNYIYKFGFMARELGKKLGVI